MEKEKIDYSIIIPIYNCEKFVKKCIKSVLNQNYENFELILIDDGSTDDSAAICKKYSDLDNRVIFVSKKNSGVSDTRNMGIKKAKGKYILFLDSDDYIEENYILSINEILKKYSKVQLINFGFYSDVNSINNEILSSDVINAKFLYMEGKKAIKDNLIYLWDKHMLYNIWNKVYVKEILEENNIEFPEYNFGEDMEFNKLYMQNIEVILNSDKCFYHYVKERKGSITASYKNDLFEIRVKEYLEFNDYFDKQGLAEKEYQEFSARRFIERVLGCVENICGSSIAFKEKRKEIKKIIKNENVNKAVRIAQPKSKKIKIMLIPIKLKSVLLFHLMGSLVSLIRKKFPSLFNQMKNKR